MEETVQIGLLYEVYGFMLTETQRALCEAYYYDDLSLSEIAEWRKISKQAVSIQLSRAVEKMNLFESHLGLLETEQCAKETLPLLAHAVESLPEEEALPARRALKRLSASLSRTRDAKDTHLPHTPERER